MTKLSGTVTIRGARPAESAVVELRNSAGDIVDQVQVDDAGRYTYHVAPGRWDLRVWDASGHRARHEVTLAEGEERVVDLDLQASQGGSR